MLLCTSILAVYYLSVQQLPYLLSRSSILKDYWGTNPKFCFILHFYCLSTIFHSTCLCHLSFILTLPPCSLLPLFESEFITQYFARSWINTRLALLALPCSRSFAEVSPRLTQNIKSTPKYQAWRGFFILFYLMLSQTTLLFFFNGVTRQYPEDLPGWQPKSQIQLLMRTINNDVFTMIFSCSHLLWTV